ncbi:MAG TPA: hypothetical protein VGX68_10895 [Thermoanaerobaculia bacterium]|nr:hypothetical protein [Thermoanaerobaculia bacterium]
MLCLLFYAAAAASAQEEPLQAFRNGEALALVPFADSARLELPGGRSLRLNLPQGATVSSFAALDGGWIAAGSAPTATGGRHLFLLQGDEKSSRSVAEPPGQEGLQRRRPVLLVDGGRLAGLAWLEGDGDTSLAVRSAAWTGRRWQAPQRVSFPGPGSQVALSGAVLDDGSWLLAWSAFDGTADEIVWSQRVGDAGGTWLPVRRVSERNAVPDIVPAVTATAGGGALLAWSRYDGRSYQLRMARFDHGEWRNEHAAGPTGSLYPTFLGEPDRPRLLYMDAYPRAWSVLDLDTAGRVKARASISSPLDRPVVSFAGGEVRMRWTGRKTSATRLEKVP